MEVPISWNLRQGPVGEGADDAGRCVVVDPHQEDCARDITKMVKVEAPTFDDKFCYRCIAHWAKVDLGRSSGSHSFVRCPLCKEENLSIIHGCVGDSFQRHYISEGTEKSFSLSGAHIYRLQSYSGKPASSMYPKFNVLQYWKCHKYDQQNQWLQHWLRREIQALIQEEDVNIIVHHILGVIESFLKRIKREHLSCRPEQKREEFKALVSDAARPFLLGRTDRFVDEVELFLISGLNINAYDELYLQNLGLNVAGETSESDETHDQNLQVPYLLFLEDMDSTD